MTIKLLIFLLILHQSFAAKILALMVVGSHSHHLWNSKYLKALSEKGHEIVYFSVDEFKNPPKNIKNIQVKDFYETLYGEAEFTDAVDKGPYGNVYLLYEYEDHESKFHLRSKAIEELKDVLKKEKFDLVVHDIASNNYLLGAVDVLGRPPIVGITAFGVPTWVQEILGNPTTYSSSPHFYTTYSNKMNILQRANNYFLHFFSFAVRWLTVRKQNEYSKECFGENIRNLEDILQDINIIMVNSNPGLDYPFPKVPGLIPVGGLHIQEPKPLPPELQSYLDESKNGVVYFSLGTNIKSSSLRRDKLVHLLKAFEQLSPVRVLWKWESPSLPGKPENVRIEKWLPQNDILAHPNVRVFFTHCGMLGVQEAIYHGKPIVGMPVFLDQHVNLEKSVQKGFGEPLHFNTLTTENVVKTIKKVLTNPRYEESVKNASKIFRDEIDNPLDRAVYWTEYVIRHKGAPHLRVSSRDLNWFQNNMYDILFIIFVFVIFFRFLIKTLLSFFFRK